MCDANYRGDVDYLITICVMFICTYYINNIARKSIKPN